MTRKTRLRDQWDLSETGERALKRLALSEEDADTVRAHIHSFRRSQIGRTPLSRKALLATRRRLRRLVEDLQRLANSYDGLRLEPPGSGHSYIRGPIVECQNLEALLGAWLRVRKRRELPEQMWLAYTCAFVRWRTSKPHDLEVADLWSELDPSAESPTSDAVRTFRTRNKDLIRRTLEFLAAEEPNLLIASNLPPNAKHL